MELEEGNLKLKVILKGNNPKNPNLLANANVSLNTVDYGFVTIKGFQIWKSRIFNERLQEEINITPPVKLGYGRAYVQAFFENKDRWFELERQIYDAYCQTRDKRKIQSDEEVDIDEVPDFSNQ